MEAPQPIYQPSGTNKKLFMLIGGLIILIIIVVLATIIVSSKRTGTGGSTGLNTSGTPTGKVVGAPLLHPHVSPTKITVSNSEITEGILSWLKTEKNADGIYYFAQKCILNNSCTNPALSYQAGISVMWGRFQHYLKTKSPDDIAAIVDDAAIYNSDKVTVLQNNFLNCTLIKDLINSNAFTDDQKKNIQNICLQSDDLPFGEIPAGKDIQVADFNKFQINQNPDTSITADAQSFSQYVFGASNNAIKSEWGRQNSLDYAKEYFNYAAQAYTRITNKTANADYPLFGVAAYDLYKQTKNNMYLNYTFYVLKHYEKSACTYLEECANLIYLSRIVHNDFSNPVYNKIDKDSTQILIDKFYDTSKSANPIANKHIFYSVSDNSSTDYPVAYNGFILGLINQ